jgi:hypothetical protein
LFNTVWRAQPSRHAASSSGTYPSGDVGHEPGTDLVGQPDPPRRARGDLLSREQADVDPAVDRVHRHAELARRALDRDELAGRVGWWRGRDAGALAHAADSSLRERQAGAGQPSLAAEDSGDLAVGVVLGEAADQLERVLAEPVLLELAGHLEREAQLGARAAFPLHFDGGASLGLVGGDDHLADQRAQQLFAIPIGRCLGGPQARQLASERNERDAFLLGQCRRAGAVQLGELPALALDGGERFLQRALERASDEPVLGLARVVLALRAAGFVLGALDRESLAGEALLVLVLKLADGRDGRRECQRNCVRLAERTTHAFIFYFY